VPRSSPGNNSISHYNPVRDPNRTTTNPAGLVPIDRAIVVLDALQAMYTQNDHIAFHQVTSVDCLDRTIVISFQTYENYVTVFTFKQEFYTDMLEQIIIEKLTRELSPEHLAVHNDSHKHAGHAGAGVETHFRIEISSPDLSGLSRVAAHQRIYQILDQEMKNRIHALQIIIK
jgi:BolA protein